MKLHPSNNAVPNAMFDRSLFNNIMTRTDSYKYSHYKQVPTGTRVMYDYITPRGGMFPYTMPFGLQALLPMLSAGFTKQDIDEAEEDVNAHFARKIFNREGWDNILNKHGGVLPLRIRAMPEGRLVPIKDRKKQHIPLVTLENTDEDSPLPSFWLPGHLETMMLRGFWYPTTVATRSFHCKANILKARMISSDDPGLEFALHDFGARGVSSGESAEIGGGAHLLNFRGSDTFEAVRWLRRNYNAERMPSNTVVAAEHSTITCWRRGQMTHEVDAYDNILAQFAEPGTIVAVVSDSYDLWAAIQHIWGGSLREKVIKSGCRIVVRPDSGDPLTVPVKAIAMLASSALFGCTTNSKGYKVLPDCVRVIQGDGINPTSIVKILDNLLASGFSADNLVFGMGGQLLQGVTRDDMEWAMKASATLAADGWWDVFKSPVDQPSKKSLAGRFAVVNDTGLFTDYETVPLIGNESRNLMATVWENGNQYVDWNFADLRKTANDAVIEQAKLLLAA